MATLKTDSLVFPRLSENPSGFFVWVSDLDKGFGNHRVSQLGSNGPLARPSRRQISWLRRPLGGGKTVASSRLWCALMSAGSAGYYTKVKENTEGTKTALRGGNPAVQRGLHLMSRTQLLNSICASPTDSQQLFNSSRCIKPNNRPIRKLQLLQALEEDDGIQKQAAAINTFRHLAGGGGPHRRAGEGRASLFSQGFV